MTEQFSRIEALIGGDAMEILQNAKVAVFGDFSPEVAETYRLLGVADLAQGNQTGAQKKLKKVKL